MCVYVYAVYIYIYVSSYIIVYLYIYIHTHTLFALQSFVTPSRAPFVSFGPFKSACRSTEAKKEGCKLIRSLGRIQVIPGSDHCGIVALLLKGDGTTGTMTESGPARGPAKWCVKCCNILRPRSVESVVSSPHGDGYGDPAGCGTPTVTLHHCQVDHV